MTSASISAAPCKGCGKPITGEKAVWHSKYCSVECKSSYLKREYRKHNPYHGPSLPSGSVGAVSELVVAADLLERGFEVYRALSPAAPCDLAILRDGRLLRVEVTSGRRRIGGGISRPQKDRLKFDILAVVVRPSNQVIYEPKKF